MKFARSTRKAHSAEFKASVVLAGLAQECTVEELCRQKEVSVSSFYEWKERFIRCGTAGLERRTPTRRTTSTTHNGISTKSQVATELAASFQKYRSDQAQFAGRMTIPEKLKAIEMVESANVPKRLALSSIGVSSTSYYHWRRLLRENGTLSARIKAPKYIKVTEREDLKKRVFKALHSPPSDYGFDRTTWRLVDLQVAIEKSGVRIGRHAIRNIIKDAGYR